MITSAYSNILGTPKEAKSLASLQGFIYLAPRPGLEPGTHGLTVRCSTG